MELLQLKYFCSAAKTENFSTTAKRFSVPPSAVSQSIRRLETELGVRLFTRRANTVSLNTVGAGFYIKVRGALTLLDEAVDSLTDEQNGKLRICINVSRKRVLPIIEKFQFLFPSVELHIKHLSNPTDEEFDLIIAGEDSRLAGYTRELLASEQLAIAIHKSNPLAAREDLSVSMLKEEPFILMNEQSSMHKTVLSVCSDFGFRPRIALQSDDPNYLVRLVNLGMGVAIIPRLLLDKSFSEEVRFFPVLGYTRDAFVYTAKNKPLSPHAEEFISMLKREYTE